MRLLLSSLCLVWAQTISTAPVTVHAQHSNVFRESSLDDSRVKPSWAAGFISVSLPIPVNVVNAQTGQSFFTAALTGISVMLNNDCPLLCGNWMWLVHLWVGSSLGPIAVHTKQLKGLWKSSLYYSTVELSTQLLPVLHAVIVDVVKREKFNMPLSALAANPTIMLHNVGFVFALARLDSFPTESSVSQSVSGTRPTVTIGVPDNIFSISDVWTSVLHVPLALSFPAWPARQAALSWCSCSTVGASSFRNASGIQSHGS